MQVGRVDVRGETESVDVRTRLCTVGFQSWSVDMNVSRFGQWPRAVYDKQVWSVIVHAQESWVQMI